MSKSNNCTVCNSENISDIINVKDVPVHCNVLWNSRDEAITAQKGNLDLVFCNNCGHVFNKTFDPGLMEYTQSYENSLHFSPKFQEYANSLASHLIEKYQIKNKFVIDIGCGKGDFLKLVCSLGSNKGYGFDPSYVPDKDDEKNDNVQFVLDFYSEKYSNYKADLIMCRHVLEHIQYPAEFVANVRKSIGDRENYTVFFEVPNVLYTIKDFGIWDLIYEHCSYFSPNSLEYIFSSKNFSVNYIKEYFNGQYLGIESKPNNSDDNNLTKQDLRNLILLIKEFSQKYDDKIKYWQNKLTIYEDENLRTVIWGGGSKGVTFLNIMQTADYIKYIVDINPRKKGKFVAGTGQEYIMPNFLSNYSPDKVIIMNAIYKEEIEKTLYELGLHSEVLIA